MRGVVLILGFIFLTSLLNRADRVEMKGTGRILALIFWALILTWAMWLTPAAAQELSRDYQQGFCTGMKLATNASMQNRDHFRHLGATASGSPPFETHDQAIARIYSPQGKDSCRNGPTVVDDTVCIMQDSIDLYVVLPPWRGGHIVAPNGTVDCSGEPK